MAWVGKSRERFVSSSCRLLVNKQNIMYLNLSMVKVDTGTNIDKPVIKT